MQVHILPRAENNVQQSLCSKVFNWTMTAKSDSDIWRPMHLVFVKNQSDPHHPGVFWEKSSAHFAVPSSNL